MIIKIDVKSDQYSQIERLVKNGKYQDIIQFIEVAITNQIQEEGSEKNFNKQVTDLETTTIQTQNTLDIFSKLQHSLKDFEFYESDIKKEYSDLIWSFYNRLFPVKIAIFQLAKMLEGKSFVDLEEWKESSLELAQNWYKILREYELEKEIKMNERLTIGLPTHKFEILRLSKKSDKIKMQKKIESSKNRFMGQFVGRQNKKTGKFEGACFTMGLISIKIHGDECDVSLTELGKRFALLENPIMISNDFSKVFSNEEVKLIYDEIFPQFKAETQIIKEVIKELKNKTMTSDEIQEIFRRYKKFILEYYSEEPEKLDSKKKEEKIVQARVATMGRLSELKIVDWKVISSISNYSINKEKMSLLNL